MLQHLCAIVPHVFIHREYRLKLRGDVSLYTAYTTLENKAYDKLIMGSGGSRGANRPRHLIFMKKQPTSKCKVNVEYVLRLQLMPS